MRARSLGSIGRGNWSCSAGRLALLAGLFFLAAVLSAPRAFARPQDADEEPEAEAKPGKTTKKPINPAELSLPPAGYAAKLRKSITEEQESGGVTVQVSVVPDAYRYAMALALEDLAKEGAHPADLEGKVRKLHSQYKLERGKALFLVSVSAARDGKKFYFLQSKVKEHVLLESGGKVLFRLADEYPKPDYVTWQVFEQRDNKRSIYKKPLSQLKDLTFSLSARLKKGDTNPVSLTIKDIVHVTDNRELQKTDYRVFESINIGQKQIATPNWKDQIVPAVTFKLYPGKWKLPRAPRAFDQILEWAELQDAPGAN